jgi:hypothetical protein
MLNEVVTAVAVSITETLFSENRVSKFMKKTTTAIVGITVLISSMTVGGNTAQNKVPPCSDCSYN